MLFLAVVILQLVPLPVNMIHLLSPYTVELRQELLQDLPDSAPYLERMSLSLYPYATWRGLRLSLMLATVFVVVLNVFRQPRQIRRLLLAISIVGCVMALLALCQDLLGNGRIYWFFEIPKGHALSGPFVHHSHYGQFMNLSMGAALGILLLKTHEAFQRQELSPAMVSDYMTSPEAKLLWFLMLFMVLGAASIFASLTRGGILSMLIAGVMTTLFFGYQKKSLQGRGWLMAFMALGAFVCIVYVGFDAIYDRLATLGNVPAAQGGRWDMLKNTLTAWQQFPILGSGLGTYEVVYPLFDNTDTSALATHAENEYVQMAAETGIVGLVVVLSFLAIIAIQYIRCLRTQHSSLSIIVYGLGYGLCAVAIHSATDFGQHLPANAVLSILFCALLLVIAKYRADDKISLVIPHPTLARRVTVFVGVLVLCFGWTRVLVDANRSRHAEKHWKEALSIKQHLMGTDWQGSDTEYVKLLTHSQAAADYQPANIHYRHWLNVFRWRAISRLKDPNTGDVLLLPETVALADRIVTEMHDGRPLCPTFGATYCVAGQIEKWVLDKPVGEVHIRKGVRLAPCDPTTRLSAGLLEAADGNVELAFEHFERAVQLNGLFYNEVAEICVASLNRPDLALKLADESTGRLNALVQLLRDDEENHVLVKEVRVRIRDALQERCKQSDVPASVYASLAYIYVREGRVEEAIEYYRRALALEYGSVHWHYHLARTLADMGAVPDAIHEAKICLRLRPNYALARQLIEDLSIRPEAVERSDASY
jgi:O-antigen ligase